MPYTRFLALLSCLIGMYSASAHAAPAEDVSLPSGGDRYAKTCTPTPSLTRHPYPGGAYIPKTNTLARPDGKALFPDGQLLYVRGRVFDQACIPLKNARVEIWHADKDGKHFYADAGDLSNPYPVFTGAGQVLTDNRGDYVFETLFPAPPSANQAPHINIRVSHPSLKRPLVTTLYFAGDRRNEDDRSYRRLPEATKTAITASVQPFEREGIGNGLLVFHDLTIGSRDGFRGF